MDQRTRQDISRRLDELERTAVRLRVGIVTDDAPLTVALGGSDVALADIRSLGGTFAVDDQVAVLTRGHDVLVLGVIA